MAHSTLSGMLASAVVKVALDRLVTALGPGDAAAATMPDDDEKLRRHMEELKQRMETIMAEVVGDAERRSVREEEDEVREWLVRLEDAAYGIWDMVDELQANQWKPVTEVRHPCFPTTTAGKGRRSTATATESRMQRAKENLDDLLQLGLDQIPLVDGAYPTIMPSSFADNSKRNDQDYIVGRDKEKLKIMSAILSADSDSSSSSTGLLVIPILGKRGIGKTTLARMVFSDATVIRDCAARAWVTVGRQFDLRKIGNCILSQLSADTKLGEDSSDVELIMKRLDQVLLTISSRDNNGGNGNKLLVVLDDLWSDDPSDLVGLRRMLGVGAAGKVVVMVTMCRKRVARALAGYVDPFYDQMRLFELSYEDSWYLLQRKLGSSATATISSFDDDERKRLPWRLHRCIGIPLVNHVIGFALRSKSPEEIRSVLYNDIWKWKLGWGEEEEDEFVFAPLLAGYQCMPPNLRLCFAYCAIFPRGHSIPRDDLVHYWTALQLIEPSSSSSDRFSTTQQQQQQLASMYIDMLLDMAFLQPTMHHPSDDGCAVSFTLHDLAHDLAKYISSDKLIVLDGTNSYQRLLSSQKNSYRQAWLTNSDISPANLSYILSSQLRVLVFYGCHDKQISDDSFSPAKYLRVLDLRDCQLQKLPDSIFQLKQLRYLNLSVSTRLVNLPDSFGNLINLGHIDLSSCTGLSKLPPSFGNLTSVMHINLSGCAGLKSLTESFGNLTNVVHVNLSGCVGLKSLTKSFGNLTNVVHVNLSGCVGLKSLTESFGNLTNVVHVNLSGCVGLKSLTKSFGNLRNVVHVNLSGCVGLKSLTKSFGNLRNVVHVNLSGCVGLKSLPESFGLLEKLEYLDLSSCSCLEGIPSVVDGLTNLQHLNLSHSCCYIAQHRFHLRGLKDVWVKLTDLRYLNLSMCLNPIFCYLPEERVEYIESISWLHTLEHLDLSHNIFLFDIPRSLGQLSQLQTLNLHGCARLKRIEKWMGETNFPSKSLVVSNCLGLETYQFVVHTDDGGTKGSNLAQLKDVSCKELEISCLEKVIFTKEAKSIGLTEKKKLQKLTLAWSAAPDGASFKDHKALLAELVPPQNLQFFELHGYNSECLPAWLMTSTLLSSHLPNLVEVSLVDISSCSNLPPFGVLPGLQRLILRRVATVTRIDAGCLSGGRLLHVTLDGMVNLEEFRNCSSSDELVMFPTLDELVINKCPKLKFRDSPPKARMLVISDCDQLMSSPVKRRGENAVEGPSSSIGTTSSPMTEVVIESCKVPLDELNWRLLQGLEPLHSLHIRNCSEKIITPEIMKGHLSSLKLLCFSHCDSMTNLPEHVVQDTSLEELIIHECRGIKSLPQSICEEKKKHYPHLRIRQCPELEKWCDQLEDNKRKLAREHIIFEGESSSSEAETSTKHTSD